MKRAFLAAPGLAVSMFVFSPGVTPKAPPVVPTPRAASAHREHVVVREADLVWHDAPNLSPGARVAVLQGDPSRPGLYVMRLKIPDGFRIAPHWHPMAEQLTVLSGTFFVQTGDQFDSSKGTPLKPGDFTMMPAKVHHFAWCQGETVVQAHGQGPFQLIYVNPKDDPSAGAKKAKAS